jgi:uncharacterized damage-inducible protein DinB
VYHTVGEFLADWKEESASTLRILSALTDASLARRVSPADRTLGRVAWHVVCAIPEMLSRTGLKVRGPEHESAPPGRAKAIAAAYRKAASSVSSAVRRQWTDASLKVEDEMYGEKWARGFTLEALVRHEIHHRGQMTVLMRQAGLKVPSVYGPSRESWAAYGQKPPEV